ncbi:rhomboid-like protein 15 [Chenopodium quinoa]|uniref:rhomboid-like protein 15 n=1 Tax=Chenopodium quinoa TaxID=63459 RepID=UPI000B792998|nr:rhomboid-like protein 15 [Chenopodium quinoa]XP_021721288.1 rhomboid-like protein 15 [Chenopodium quinoa]
MRPNIVSEASVSTRVNQWWEGIPFITSAVVAVCAAIYLVCLLIGYDSFVGICFLPSAIISQFQVYRIYTSILFHGSFLHLFFNMLALVPLGSELERIMGSVRLLYTVLLLALSNAVLHLLIALLVAYNPFYPYSFLMNECAIGFSGILFSMIVIESSLSGVHSRSVFGLFNVPAKWYPWILLLVFQLLLTNISLLGHLSGILSGFAYTYGLFNLVIPGTSFFSGIENSTWLSACVRRPKFILCTGGNPSGHIPTYTNPNSTSSGSATTNLWSHLSSLMPQRDTSSQSTDSTQDTRFPGRGRTLGAPRSEMIPGIASDSNLQTRLLDNANSNSRPDMTAINSGGERPPAVNSVTEPINSLQQQQALIVSEEDIQKLVSMGFDKTQVEVALAAADGDLDVAVEILMTQQG